MTRPRLEAVDADNVDAACALRLRPDQERYVEPVAHSLALAYTLPDLAWPRLVYDGDELVAFVMAFHHISWSTDPPGQTRSGIWRLNVAAAHQGRGYGRFAIEAVCTDLRGRGERAAYVTWEPGADGPENFYLRLGFRPTGEVSGEQTVGRRDL